MTADPTTHPTLLPCKAAVQKLALIFAERGLGPPKFSQAASARCCPMLPSPALPGVINCGIAGRRAITIEMTLVAHVRCLSKSESYYHYAGDLDISDLVLRSDHSIKSTRN